MQESQSAATASPTVTTIEQDGWTVTSASADHPTAVQLSERLEPETPASPAADVAAPQEPPAELPTAEGEAPPPLPGKRKQSSSERHAELQAQIDATTRERHEARRALEAERAELERLRRERETLTKPPPAAPAAPSPTRPTWAMYEAAGKTYEDYETDTAAWLDARIEAGTKAAETRAQQIADERLRTEQHRTSTAQVLAQHSARIDKARADHPDFDAVITALDEVPRNDFLDRVILDHPHGGELLYYLGQHADEAATLASLPMTRPMLDAVREAPNPAPLLSWFAQHPGEHDRITRLPLPRQLLALGALSAQLTGANTGSPAVASVSSAKPPIRPPGGSLSAGGSHSDDPPHDLEAYIRWADAREARAGRLG